MKEPNPELLEIEKHTHSGVGVIVGAIGRWRPPMRVGAADLTLKESVSLAATLVVLVLICIASFGAHGDLAPVQVAPANAHKLLRPLGKLKRTPNEVRHEAVGAKLRRWAKVDEAPDDSLPRVLIGGAAALPAADLTRRNGTVFELAGGQCVQRATILPSLSCTIPGCNRTRREGKLLVLTNRKLREHVGHLRFELGGLTLPAAARLADVELQLTGTGRCSRRTSFNWTHQLHLLEPGVEADRLSLNKPLARRLTAQWSRVPSAEQFRVPLSLSAEQLVGLRRDRRISLALSEKLFGRPDRHAVKTARQTCAYYSSSRRESAKWPRLSLTFSWPCCERSGGGGGGSGGDGSGGGGDGNGDDDVLDRARSAIGRARSAIGRARVGAVAVTEDDEERPRPRWIGEEDWEALPAQERLRLPWLTALPATEAPAWTVEASSDGTPPRCEAPGSAHEARGGQRGVPSGTRAAVSIILTYSHNESAAAECLAALWACAHELPSTEYLVVDDGSTEQSGVLARMLARLAATFGIRYEHVRYAAPVGHTRAASEAARRANGTHLLLLKDTASIRRGALRALHSTFDTAPDVGVVGGRLLDESGAVAEAGSIVWSDGTTAPYRGHADGTSHRLSYARDVDYVSSAVAMVPRELFLSLDMFDPLFSPGYHEIAIHLRSRRG
jgi:hypothetical protein